MRWAGAFVSCRTRCVVRGFVLGCLRTAISRSTAISEGCEKAWRNPSTLGTMLKQLGRISRAQAKDLEGARTPSRLPARWLQFGAGANVDGK